MLIRSMIFIKIGMETHICKLSARKYRKKARVLFKQYFTAISMNIIATAYYNVYYDHAQPFLS